MFDQKITELDKTSVMPWEGKHNITYTIINGDKFLPGVNASKYCAKSA